MANVIVGLLERGTSVSLVTAAGYPGHPERYEERLRGILEAIQHLPPSVIKRFLVGKYSGVLNTDILTQVMGGECNYMLETSFNADTGCLGLQSVEGEKWKDGRYRIRSFTYFYSDEEVCDGRNQT